jgi:hypothetical protein
MSWQTKWKVPKGRRSRKAPRRRRAFQHAADYDGMPDGCLPDLFGIPLKSMARPTETEKAARCVLYAARYAAIEENRRRCHGINSTDDLFNPPLTPADVDAVTEEQIADFLACRAGRGSIDQSTVKR